MIGVVGLVGMGYGTWAVISPGEERKREILKVLKHYTFAAVTNDNVAHRFGGQK
uniref:Uncharacterized protein n=1 Tax=Cyprinus carpio carpio TaxID=630221 RepID=A0A9J7YFJ2_CYPCA